MNIYDDITYVKGVGPKSAEKLNKCGIFNLLDLLLYFPRDYENIFAIQNLNEIQKKEKAILEVEVEKICRDIKTKTGKVMSTVIFTYEREKIKGIWFNQPYAKNSFSLGGKYLINGILEKKGKEYIISNAKIMRNTAKTSNDIMAKYPLKDNLNNTFLNKVITEVLSKVNIKENLPQKLLEKYEFMPLNDAIRNIHNPTDIMNLERARRRLKFQELFIYSLKLMMLKNFNGYAKGIQFNIVSELKELKESLPFKLTEAQSKAVREILIDEKKPIPMNRLVQGDVGSGKTVVSLITMFNVVKNGYQVAMMAPTEILAKQHYSEAIKIYEPFGITVELLTGSITEKNKEVIKEKLKSGEIQVIIGTHALIEDNVVFNNLGMIVTDEQHRFGVGQRSKLNNKGENIDVLVMSATPIPRTLCLYLYGDLDVSIIDSLPPGRKPIDTYYINSSEKNRVYNFALREIQSGRQAYVVCPLVEENEDMKLSSVTAIYEELKKNYFRDVEIAILHGKMSNKDKNFIMDRFKNEEIKVLIATTVIEVGVNVPNSTIMIIENAERFGLAQLHQLRGRVGRGSYKSYCMLIANIKSETTKKRMDIMKNSNDGFYISEQDLKLRGSGEMFGSRQSGENGLILADLINDFNLFKIANEEAKELINSNDNENKRIVREIMSNLERSTKYICFN